MSLDPIQQVKSLEGIEIFNELSFSLAIPEAQSAIMKIQTREMESSPSLGKIDRQMAQAADAQRRLFSSPVISLKDSPCIKRILTSKKNAERFIISIENLIQTNSIKKELGITLILLYSKSPKEFAEGIREFLNSKEIAPKMAYIILQIFMSTSQTCHHFVKWLSSSSIFDSDATHQIKADILILAIMGYDNPQFFESAVSQSLSLGIFQKDQIIAEFNKDQLRSSLDRLPSLFSPPSPTMQVPPPLPRAADAQLRPPSAPVTSPAPPAGAQLRPPSAPASSIQTDTEIDNPRPEIHINIPIHLLEMKKSFICKGTIDGTEVTFFVSSNQWENLKITKEEYQAKQIDLVKHFHEIIPQTGPFALMSYGNGIDTEKLKFSLANHATTRIVDETKTPFLLLSLYNPTDGKVKDIIRTTKERSGTSTPIVQQMRQFMVWLSSLLDYNPNAGWLAVCHSEGGVILKRAIESMLPVQQATLRRFLTIYAAGPAEPLHTSQGNSVFNVYSESDYVTGYGPFGKAKEHMRDCDILTLQCESERKDRIGGVADHGFMKPTYFTNFIGYLQSWLHVQQSRAHSS
jgi:hypothetical protein